jgi:hypothetical protein
MGEERLADPGRRGMKFRKDCLLSALIGLIVSSLSVLAVMTGMSEVSSGPPEAPAMSAESPLMFYVGSSCECGRVYNRRPGVMCGECENPDSLTATLTPCCGCGKVVCCYTKFCSECWWKQRNR